MPREWVINAYEGFEGLCLQECNREEPSATEVRIHIEAFALNWGDNDSYTKLFPRESCSLMSTVSSQWKAMWMCGVTLKVLENHTGKSSSKPALKSSDMNRVDRLRETMAYEDIDLSQSYAGFLMPELEVVSARDLKVTNA